MAAVSLPGKREGYRSKHRVVRKLGEETPLQTWEVEGNEKRLPEKILTSWKLRRNSLSQGRYTCSGKGNGKDGVAGRWGTIPKTTGKCKMR